MSLHSQLAAARLLASFADPALIGANDDRTWPVRSQRHCAHAAWKKAGYGALKARARSLSRLRDNASFATLSVCGWVDSEDILQCACDVPQVGPVSVGQRKAVIAVTHLAPSG